MIKTKKQMFIVIGAFLLTILLGTVTYAFFNYTRTGTANVIKTGKISFNTTQGENINLTNMFPIDVSEGIPNDNTKVGTVTINVTGDTTYENGIEYLVTATNVQNTVGNKTLPISIDVSVESNTHGEEPNQTTTTLGTEDSDYFTNRGASSETSIYKVLASDVIENNEQLVVGYIKSGATGVDGNIVIKAYLDKAKIAITDTYDGNETDNMGTTTSWVDDRVIFTTEEWNSLQTNGVSFQVKVESNEEIWVENPNKLYKKIRSSLTNNNSITDEDNITYISGCREDFGCDEKNIIDFNYVWYSGKLWRAVSIYEDGTMKLMTENPITTIAWGENTTYENSWVYQWLNEDFRDTLVNRGNVIDSSKEWNATETSTTEKPENTTMVTGDVGLLNIYEVNNIESIPRNIGGYYNVYLAIDRRWWLINPYNSENISFVNGGGQISYSTPYYRPSYGVRPAIYMKSSVTYLSGTGSRSNPYRIGEDISTPSSSAKLNTRVSGEYVSFKNNLFRIVGIENNTTKIVTADYLKIDGNIGKKKLASTNYFGKSGNVENDEYWDYYLNNSWLSTSELNFLALGTYYYGEYGNANGNNDNYKKSICTTVNNNTNYNQTTKLCEKSNSVYTGYVGTLRVGEMFSSILLGDYTNMLVGDYTGTVMWKLINDNIFLITPYRTWGVESVSYDTGVDYNNPGNNYAIKPTVNLKSEIIITGGTGTEHDPFIISLPE